MPMNYEEFVAWDKKRAYFEYIPVTEAKEKGFIPSKFHDLFPDKCVCGSDNVIKTNLKSLMCCDPNCYIKMAYAMAEMFANFGCQGIGPETCKTICQFALNNNVFTVPTHTEILGIDRDSPLKYVLGASWYTLIENIEIIRHKKMSFGTMISKISIPFYQEGSSVLFKDLNSVEDLLKIEQTKTITAYLAERGVKSLRKVKALYNNIGTIYMFEANMAVPFIRAGLSSRGICITGRVSVDGYSMTRKEFLDFCNSVCNINGVQLITIYETSGPRTASHIVADYPSASSKYRVGLDRERYEEGVLITAQQYVDSLREEVNLCLKTLAQTTS